MTQIRRLLMATGSLNLLLVASMGAVSVKERSSDESCFSETEFICLDGRRRFWKGSPICLNAGCFCEVELVCFDGRRRFWKGSPICLNAGCFCEAELVCLDGRRRFWKGSP